MGRTLLGTAEEGAVLLEGEVDLDEAGALEELDDHARRDDGRDAELHERAAVRGQDDAHPVERVCGRQVHEVSFTLVGSGLSPRGERRRTRRVGRDDAIERDLRADEEDEEGDGRPADLGEGEGGGRGSVRRVRLRPGPAGALTLVLKGICEAPRGARQREEPRGGREHAAGEGDEERE